MQTMNISLPDQLKEFVDNQVGSGRYSSVSGYVRDLIRDLIRDDEKRKAQEKLEALLMEGIQSGEPIEMRREDWEDIRREAVKQFEARKSQKWPSGPCSKTRGCKSGISEANGFGMPRMRASTSRTGSFWQSATRSPCSPNNRTAELRSLLADLNCKECADFASQTDSRRSSSSTFPLETELTSSASFTEAAS